MLKRCFSLMLALMMVFSMLPAQAMASELPELETEPTVQETQAPAPETEPAEADPTVESAPATEAAPATGPVPATEAAPATEPVPVTEPVPAETVSGQVTDEPALAGTVNIGITRDDGTGTSIEVTLGDTFTLPEPGEGKEYYEFDGWMLARSDGARFMEDGQFEDVNAIDPNSSPKYFPAGTVFDTDDLDFENYDGYSFKECWTFTGTYTWVRFYPTANEDKDGFGENVVVGDSITIPAHGVEGAADTFDGWFLLRDDGAWYTGSGFTKDESVAAKTFQPGESFVLSKSLLEEEYTSLYFHGIWKDHVMFQFYNGMDPMSVAYGETLTFPAYGEVTPGYQFTGWSLDRSDNTGLTVNMEFSDEWVDPLQRYAENETLTVTRELFDNSKYIYCISGSESEIPNPSKLHIGFRTTGSWQDPSWGAEAHLGETFTVDISDSGLENEPAGWFLTRDDDARYTADGTFTTDDSVASRVFADGDTLELDEELFDPENHEYIFYAIWDNTLAVAFNDGQPAQYVPYGENVTLPLTCLEQMDGHEFVGWHLKRNDDAYLGESGSFSVEWVEPYKTYEPGAVVTVSSTLFDNTRYTYIFTPAWREADDPNKLTFSFNPNNGGDSLNVRINIGETYTIPGIDYDDFDGLEFITPDADFTGWFLQRDDGAWYTADGSFTTEESVASRIFTADEKVTFDADAFDNEKYDYFFRGIWDGVVTFMFAGRDAVAVEFGKSITFPENTQTMEGFEFGYFELSRSDGKWLCTDGTFRDDYEVASKEFDPDDSFEVSADLFDTSKYTYHIGGIFFKIKDPNVLNGNFMPDSNSENNFGSDISLTEEFEVPDHGIDAADGVFEGWLLLREYDGAWYTEDGTFSLDPDDAPCIFVPGETVQLNAAAFDTLEYYYSFYGIWEDTITFYFWDGHEPVAVTYGEELTFPYNHWSAFPPSFEIFGWIIVRNDGAILMEDGTFSLDEDGKAKIFDEGESYKIKEEAFNNKDYIYYISSYGQEVPDEDVIEFFFSPTGSFMFGEQEKGYIGEEFEIPDYELDNPGFEFEGWFLTREVFDEEDYTTTTARYTTGNAFSTSSSAVSKIFKPGDTLTLAKSKFKNDDNTSYTFNGIWKDAVNFFDPGSGNSETIAYGDKIVFPRCTEEGEENYVFDGWIIWRNDGAVLTDKGTFSQSGEWDWFFPGDTLEVTEKLFNNTKYTYIMSSTWSEVDAVMTEELLRQQLADDEIARININTDLTLTKDLIIPAGKTVVINRGVTLTVPAGVMLNVEGDQSLVTYYGHIVVEEGASLAAQVPYAIYLGDGATLDVTGANLSVVPTGISVEELTRVSGIETTILARFNIVKSMAEVKAALELVDDYALLNINCVGTFTITEDLTMPENVCFVLQSWTENGAAKPAKVTLKEGKTLTVKGDVEIYDTCVLTVASGATLDCDGKIYVFEGAKLTNNGAVLSYPGGVEEHGTVGGSKQVTYSVTLYNLDYVDEIQNKIAEGANDITIVNAWITIWNDMEIPTGVKLAFDLSTLFVAPGVTLTNNGQIYLRKSEFRLLETDIYADPFMTGMLVGEVIADAPSYVNPEEMICSTRTVDGQRYITMGIPKATAVVIKDERAETVSGTTIKLDLKQLREAQGTDADPLYQLTSEVESMYALQDVTWKTSSAAIADVDDNGLLALHKPGTVTITATAKDGSKKAASVKIQVYWLDPAAKLTTVGVDVPDIGLQETYKTVMYVYGEYPISFDLLEIYSSDPEIASVDDYGCIVAESVGTATITARLRNDPLNREVSVKVKVIPLQTSDLKLKPDVTDLLVDSSSIDGIHILDAYGNPVKDLQEAAEIYVDERLLEGGNIITIESIAKAYTYEGGERTVEPGIKWTTSDTRVATVLGYEDGTAEVVLKTDGAVTITAEARDLAKVQKTLVIHICDYAPRLGTTSLTLNSNVTEGVSVPLLESYGREIIAESVKLYEYDEASKSYVEASDLTAIYEDQMLTIQYNGALANGTRKLRLEVNIEGNEAPYTYDMSLKVANKMPAVTVKQLNKLDLLYTNSMAELLITAKDAQIVNVELHPENTAPFGLEWDENAGVAYIRNQSSTAKPNTSLVLKITLDGYDVTIKKTVKISTVTTKPSLALSAASSTISTYDENMAPITTFSILNKKTKEPLDLTEYNVYTDDDGIASLEYDLSFDCETVTLRLKADAEGNVTGGTVNVYVQHKTWATPVKLTHKVTVKDTLPTVTLSTPKLNRALPYQYGYIEVKLSQSNWKIVDIRTPFDDIEGEELLNEQVVVDYVPETEGFVAAVNPKNLPAKGTYKFDCEIVLTDENEEYEVAIPKTVKVTVVETAPVVKIGTIKLNNYFKDGAIANVPVTVTKAENYQLDGFEIPENYDSEKVQLTSGDGGKISVNDEFVLKFAPENCMLYVDMLRDDVANGKRTFELTPVMVSAEEAIPPEVSKTKLKPIKVTVDIYNGKPSVSVSAKGKLDSLDPDSCIVYTVNKATNFYDDYFDHVELRGEDADLFQYETYWTEEGKFTVVLHRAVDEYGVPAPVVTNKTYNLQLAFYAEWFTEDNGVEDDEGFAPEVAVNNIKVKFTQSSLKFAKIPTLNLYQSSDMPLTCKVELTSPAGAMLDENSISLGSKTAAQFKTAFGDEGELNFDTETGMLTIGVENPGALSYGKSYTVYLDVTPADSATNVKPTQLKLTVKVFK